MPTAEPAALTTGEVGLGPLTADLAEFVEIASVDGTDGEVEIQHRLAERLAAEGLDVDLWALDLPLLRSLDGYPGEEVDRTEAWGLVAVSGPGEVGLILQAHVDVVPPGDRSAWSVDPFAATIADGRLIGRGATDMKAGVAAILAAVRAVRIRLGSLADAPTFAVQFVVGEEDGGLGTFASLQRGHRGRACVIPEPTGLDLITANAGALTFTLEVPGLATHGSTPYAGSSAIDSYLQLHTALAELQNRRNADPEPLLRTLPIPYPISVGRLSAGDWPSSVPDRLVAEGRYGLRIDEDPMTAQKEFAEVIDTAADTDPYLRDHRPVLRWNGGQFRGGALPSGHALRDRVSTVHTDVTGGPPPKERGAPYGSDLRLYAAAGIPTLHYGAGDVRLAHGPDESVDLAEMQTAARGLGTLLLRGV